MLLPDFQMSFQYYQLVLVVILIDTLVESRDIFWLFPFKVLRLFSLNWSLLYNYQE